MKGIGVKVKEKISVEETKFGKRLFCLKNALNKVGKNDGKQVK